MTPEEVNLAKSFLKDKVKDQVQELLDEARNNVQDKVGAGVCMVISHVAEHESTGCCNTIPVPLF